LERRTRRSDAPPGTGLDPRVLWRAITDPALQDADLHTWRSRHISD
jgi:hypothetical protein